MIFTSLKRIIRNAFTNFWRNGSVSLATMLVMMLAIFMAGSLILFQVLLNSTLEQVESKVDITVFFRTDASESDVFHVRDLLSKLPEVARVEYISREDALAQFKARHEDNALISSALDELGDNPLGANLHVQAHNPSEYGLISQFLEKGNFASVDKVNFRQNELVFERLETFLGLARRVGLGISLVLGFIAFLVVFNTVRLAIYTSREEISIMRLVGASNWYVRGPFLVEGVIHGIFASILTALVFWPVTLWIGPKAQTFFGGVDLFEYYVSNLAQFFLALMIVGVVLGIFSSFVATRRYLKV